MRFLLAGAVVPSNHWPRRGGDSREVFLVLQLSLVLLGAAFTGGGAVRFGDGNTMERTNKHLSELNGGSLAETKESKHFSFEAFGCERSPPASAWPRPGLTSVPSSASQLAAGFAECPFLMQVWRLSCLCVLLCSSKRCVRTVSGLAFYSCVFCVSRVRSFRTPPGVFASSPPGSC